MSGHVCVSGEWKELSNLYARVSGEWKELTEGWARVSGEWQKIWEKIAGLYLLAWGRNNYGQLGDGTTTGRNSPTLIGSCTWKAIAAGYYHSLGIRADDRLLAWGWNANGQLGDGTGSTRYSPTLIGSCTWKAIAAGQYHSLGIKV